MSVDLLQAGASPLLAAVDALKYLTRFSRAAAETQVRVIEELLHRGGEATGGNKVRICYHLVVRPSCSETAAELTLRCLRLLTHDFLALRIVGHSSDGLPFMQAPPPAVA